MGITEVLIAPRSPWQNAHVERVIGSIRRECLDHLIIFNERHLRRSFPLTRTTTTEPDASIAQKRLPGSRPVRPSTRGKVIAIPQVGGLHHRYERLAA